MNIMRVVNGVLGTFALFGALAVAGCGDASPTDESVGMDHSLLTEGACMAESLGDETSCKPADVWREYAARACENRGLALTDFAQGAACDGGNGAPKYSCCKQAPKPEPDRACFGDAQGGPTSCKPADAWTKFAAERCSEKGSNIVQISFADRCEDGSFRFVRYECGDAALPPPPPPPPPVECKTTEIRDLKCEDVGLIKERAFDICAAANLVLTDLAVDGNGACTDDKLSAAKVTCCAPAQRPEPTQPKDPPPDRNDPGEQLPKEPPPTNPDGNTCTVHDFAFDDCGDPGAIKERAAAVCSAEKLELTELGLSDCKDGEPGVVRFACCGARP